MCCPKKKILNETKNHNPPPSFLELIFIRHWLRLPGLGNNNEKLGLPERLSAGIQFRFRSLFHGKISDNRDFICLYVASISKTSGNFSNIFLIISSWKKYPIYYTDSFANTSTVAPAKRGLEYRLEFEEVTFRASVFRFLFFI